MSSLESRLEKVAKALEQGACDHGPVIRLSSSAPKDTTCPTCAKPRVQLVLRDPFQPARS